MKTILLKAMLVTGILSLAACGGNGLNNQLIKTAPMSQEDTGYIVKGVDKNSLESWLLENKDVNYRIINERHQLYEVFNSDAETLRSQFPNAKIEKNLFVESHSFTQTKNEVLTIKNLTKELQNLKPLDGDEDKKEEKVDYSTLNDCKESETKAPVLNIDAASEEMKEDLKDSTIEIGKNFTISSLKSESLLENKDLKLAWLVYAPKGSLLGQKVILGGDLDYTPDSIGAYYILAVAQDSDNVCTFKQFPIVVTKNAPFDTMAASKAANVSNTDLKPFWQLDMVSATEAWTLSKGEGVKIAVIDSGVNYNHFAISPNIQVNAHEIPDNGLDDDGNGFKDDYTGYDFLNSDSYPYDDSGHGTHVATTAASHIMGIAPHAKIIPIKALSSAGGDAASLTGAIYYAVDQGAQVINMSLGSYSISPEFLLDALTFAANNNIVLVAAAGNGHPQTGLGLNTDVVPNYPSSMEIAGLIAVAATGDGKTLASYSNFGKKSVDVVAPGGSKGNQMYAGFKENKAGIIWEHMQGTSMAAPVVAGITALVRSANPALDIIAASNVVISSGVQVDNYVEVTTSGRLVNAASAVKMAMGTPLAAVQ